MAKRLTTEDWVNRAKEVHGDLYDYSKTSYTISREKVSITCKKHGDFKQFPYDHINGRGCAACGTDATKGKRAKPNKTQNQFVGEANKVHNGLYDYTRSKYTGAWYDVTIVCRIHGEFTQQARSHLSGHGCDKCARKVRSESLRGSVDKFLFAASSKYGGKFSYTNCHTDSVHDTIDIHCNKHNISYKDTMRAHLNASHCPQCVEEDGRGGFKSDRPAYLYYLKVTTDNNEILYKIGITNRSVEQRFSLSELAKIEVVRLKLYTNGRDALDKETELLKKYKEFKYTGPAVLDSGNTELFTIDVLNMFHK